jgi:hypothetical protein
MRSALQVLPLASTLFFAEVAAAESASRQCTQAREEALALKTEVALAHFAEALRRFDVEAAGAVDVVAWWECHLFAGEAWLDKGKQEQAIAAFERALFLRPSAQPDPKVFSPRTVAAFRRAMKTVSARERGSLTIVGEPRGAEIVLDAVVQGRSPITLSGVIAGEHWLVVRAQGYAPFSGKVDVKRTLETRTEVFLRPLSGADAPTPPAAPPPAPVDASPLARSSAPVTVIVPAVTPRTHPFVAILPFGVAQFAEQRIGPAIAFLLAEVALLAGNIVSAALIAENRIPGTDTYRNPAQSRALQVVNIVTFSALLGTIAGGVADGWAHR